MTRLEAGLNQFHNEPTRLYETQREKYGTLGLHEIVWSTGQDAHRSIRLLALSHELWDFIR